MLTKNKKVTYKKITVESLKMLRFQRTKNSSSMFSEKENGKSQDKTK